MRIAIDARELCGQPTGVGRYLSELLRAWNDLPGAAAHEYILCSHAPIALDTTLRVTTLVEPGDGTRWEQLALPRLVRRARANVLFAPAYTAPLTVTAPIVLAVHDVSFAAHPEWFSWREGVRRRLLTRASAHRARRVLAISGVGKQEIVRRLGIYPDKVEVIYPGVHALGGGRLVSANRSREPLVLYVGSIFNRRHVPALIEGFSRLAALRPEIRLALVGHNRTHPHLEIERMIAESPAAARITLQSYIAEPELERLYADASAFAFLSSYEGFGFTTLEALTAGVPPVVLETAVAREICGPSAFYVQTTAPGQIADALETALFNTRERERVLGTAAGTLRRYSWPDCARRTLQVILACAS